MDIGATNFDSAGHGSPVTARRTRLAGLIDVRRFRRLKKSSRFPAPIHFPIGTSGPAPRRPKLPVTSLPPFSGSQKSLPTTFGAILGSPKPVPTMWLAVFGSEIFSQPLRVEFSVSRMSPNDDQTGFAPHNRSQRRSERFCSKNRRERRLRHLFAGH